MMRSTKIVATLGPASSDPAVLERMFLAGTTLEGCIAQSAIDARERGLKVTILARACARIDAAAEQAALAYLERIVEARIETQALASTLRPRTA